MKRQQGFGLISTIIILTIVAALGWLAFTRMANIKEQESANEAVERAKVNVDKANEARNKVQDVIDTTTEALNEIDGNSN